MACISVARLFLCICASRGVTPPTRGRGAGAGGGGQLFTVIQCYVHCCDPTCTALISVQVLCALCAHYCPRVLCALCTQPIVLCASTFAVFSSSGWNLTVASFPITNLIFPNIARVSLIDHSILFARSCVALLCLGMAGH